jgi:hypothetical protein
LTYIFLEIEPRNSFDGGIFLSTVFALPKRGVGPQAALLTDKALVFRKIHKTLNRVRVVALALGVVEMFP